MWRPRQPVHHGLTQRRPGHRGGTTRYLRRITGLGPPGYLPSFTLSDVGGEDPPIINPKIVRVAAYTAETTTLTMWRGAIVMQAALRTLSAGNCLTNWVFTI